MEKKIVVAGHISVDMTPVFQGSKKKSLSQILCPGKLIRTGDMVVYSGGVVSNTGLALHKMGANVHLAGKIGNDALGEMMLAMMKQHGTEKDLIIDDAVSTSYTIVIAPPGIDRVFLHGPGGNDTFVADDLKEELLDGAVLYIRIYFLGMPAMALYNFGNAVCSAFGDTKKPLYYLGAAGIVNIVLNLFFVIVCKMDVAGVAAASIISQYLSAFLILRALVKVGGDYALRLSKLRFDKRMAGYLIQIGLPAGLQNGIFQVANLFIQAGVNTFDAIMVAGNSAAANADALLYDSMAAFYTACGSFMGQNYGAGKRKRVRNSYLVSLAYSFGIGTIGGIALVIFGRQFLGLFTNDPAVVDAGMKRLTIMGFSYGFSAFMDSAIAASRALGKECYSYGYCNYRILYFPNGMGKYGVCLL